MAGRMSPLFQLWFSMTFPDQEVCKSTIIGTELVTTVECQRQCGVSSTVCNVPDSVQCRQQKISCLLKIIASCQRLSAIQHTASHWFYITVNNLCKLLQKFHDFTIIFMTFHDVRYFPRLLRPEKRSY